MPSQIEIRQTITNRIIDALKDSSQLPPWRKPWSSDPNALGAPANIVSGKRYSGVNPLLLDIAAHRHGFKSRFFGTYRQWEGICGQVKKRPADVSPGEWGTTIVFCKPITKKEAKENGEEAKGKFFLLKTFVVFNIDQVEGAHLDRFRVGTQPVSSSQIVERFEVADKAIDATGADIRFGGNRACYNPATDIIQMPERSQFSGAEFYETLCHELVHWTEPASRLNWDRKGEGYAMGELIAEMGGCFMCSELGLPTADNLENHASYLKSWLAAMQNDAKFIFRAATEANKAVDYLLSFSRTAAAAEEPVLVV